MVSIKKLSSRVEFANKHVRHQQRLNFKQSDNNNDNNNNNNDNNDDDDTYNNNNINKSVKLNNLGKNQSKTRKIISFKRTNSNA